MKFNPEKYKYFVFQSRDHASTQITAVSTYAGKTVKGHAKCDPNDTYNEEKGKALAAARCNYKVACMRQKRAERKYKEAEAMYIKAKAYLDDMGYYLADSNLSVGVAHDELQDILETM